MGVIWLVTAAGTIFDM